MKPQIPAPAAVLGLAVAALSIVAGNYIGVAIEPVEPTPISTAYAEPQSVPIVCAEGEELQPNGEGYSCGPADEADPGAIQEDDPGWDCRVMGNRECGVEVVTGGEHVWYVISFDANGNPIGVRTR